MEQLLYQVLIHLSKGTDVQGTFVQGDFGPKRLLSKEAFTSDKLSHPDKTDEGHSEAVSNILLLREERAECVIRKMWCNIQNQEARKITTNKKRVWTRNNKTGL